MALDWTPISSGVAIRCARRTVHTCPPLWGHRRVRKRGEDPFEILAHGPAPTLLRHRYGVFHYTGSVNSNNNNNMLAYKAPVCQKT